MTLSWALWIYKIIKMSLVSLPLCVASTKSKMYHVRYYILSLLDGIFIILRFGMPPSFHPSVQIYFFFPLKMGSLYVVKAGVEFLIFLTSAPQGPETQVSCDLFF